MVKELLELPELSQNVWYKYGFHANPFDINPLSYNSNSLLSVSEAIVGRDFNTKESKLLTSILRNPGGGRVIVTGNIGVGKTTFMNYHRYLWENHAKDKLFTTDKEISVSEEWQLSHFLINILCSIVDKLIQTQGEENVIKNTLFKELLALSKVFYHTNFSFQGSLLGFGGGFGKDQQVNIPVIPETQLIRYLHETVLEIKKMGYSGLFLHIDNLELFSQNKSQKAKTFFEGIRDSIQTPDIYFIFVAKKGFFQEIISPLERVRSIFFGRPILVPPLSKTQVIDAIHKRYHLLAIEEHKMIRPVEDLFIESLYDLYSGRLRYIMDAMNMILSEFDSGEVRTISKKEAEQCLSGLVREQVQSNLTPKEWEVFLFCLSKDNFTNTLLQKKFKMPGPNITRLIKRFLSLDLLYLEKREGRSLFYKANEYTKIITSSVNNKNLSQKPLATKDISFRIIKAKEIIQERKTISRQEYASLLSVSSSTATRDLKKLTEMGIITKRGNTRATLYQVIK